MAKDIKAKSVNLNTTQFDFRENDESPHVETLKEGIAPAAFKRGEVDYLIVNDKYCPRFSDLSP